MQIRSNDDDGRPKRRGIARANIARTALLLAVCLLAPRKAHAVPPAGAVVRVHVTACADEPYDSARMVELLGVELAQYAVAVEAATASPPAGDALAVVSVEAEGCGAAPEVKLEVIDRVSSKRIERRMAIADLNRPDRPRALAISIAELLNASWLENELSSARRRPVELPAKARAALLEKLVMAPPPLRPRSSAREPKVAARPKPLQAPPEPPERDEERSRVGTTLVARSFPSGKLGWLGAQVAIVHRLLPHVSVTAGGELAFGSATIAELTADSPVSNVASNSELFYLGASLASSGWVQLEVGPRLLAGHAGLDSRSLGKSEGAIVIVALTGDLLAKLSRRWFISAGIEAGYTLRSVELAVVVGGDDGVATIGAGAKGVNTCAKVGAGLSF